MLETVNYPFIVNFIRTFKDSRFCYFLEEYLKGVELSTVVRNLGKKLDETNIFSPNNFR